MDMEKLVTEHLRGIAKDIRSLLNEDHDTSKEEHIRLAKIRYTLTSEQVDRLKDMLR